MIMRENCVIKTENLTKEYKLGVIGSGTLRHDLQSWYARIRGRENPNLKIGATQFTDSDRFLALDSLNLEVNRGERLGIIGSNGAGKSTFLKLLSRVTAPTDGEIKFRGRIASMLEVGTGFHPELTGRENIYLNGAILGMSKAEITSKIDKIIEFSECEKFIDTPVKRYSSGMFVKLAFAVAAHLDAEILIMDEVLAVGDAKFQKKCINKMREIALSEDRTVLYVSHNMNTIRQLCSRCIVLEQGKNFLTVMLKLQSRFTSAVTAAMLFLLSTREDIRNLAEETILSFCVLNILKRPTTNFTVTNLFCSVFFGKTKPT